MLIIFIIFASWLFSLPFRLLADSLSLFTLDDLFSLSLDYLASHWYIGHCYHYWDIRRPFTLLIAQAIYFRETVSHYCHISLILTLPLITISDFEFAYFSFLSFFFFFHYCAVADTHAIIDYTIFSLLPLTLIFQYWLLLPLHYWFSFSFISHYDIAIFRHCHYWLPLAITFSLAAFVSLFLMIAFRHWCHWYAILIADTHLAVLSAFRV